tara:strand:- start:265 stop:1044 length:780 start_codon:yes stop_codon:yes gene_type:complete
MAEFQFIDVRKVQNACIITINREEKMNALNRHLLQEIKRAVEVAEKNDENHGIILTGKGEKAFAAGADIAEFADFDSKEGKAMSAEGHEVMNALEQCSKPTIAAINGYALGGGNELAMACHLRIASPNAVFGQPEVKLGLPPGYGGTQRLIQLVGKAKALELNMTGKNIQAEEAHHIGLVNAIVKQEDLMKYCLDIISTISKRSPMAIASIIRCTNAYFSEQDGHKTEIEEFGNSFQTDDFSEGTSAFLNKTKANFRKS